MTINNEMEVALNESTSAEVLRQLALQEKSAMLNSLYDINSRDEEAPPQYNKSKSILRAIAKNPNTPPDILKELFSYCPVEVLNNITLNLLILENCFFLEEIYKRSSDTRDVFGMDNIPLFFEEWGVNNKDSHIRQSAAINIKTLSLLDKCSNDDNSNVRTCVAVNENTPGYILEKLALDEDKEVREAIASNSNTPKNILSILAKDKNLTVRCSVAGNPSTPEDILESLAQSKSKDIRENIAGNPNVSVKTLEFLAHGDCEFMLIKIAYNKKVTPNIFRILAKKNNYFVNQAINEHSQAPHDVLELIENFNNYDDDYAQNIPY